MRFESVGQRSRPGVPAAVVLCLLLTAAPGAASESPEGWQRGRRVHGIDLYRKPVAGSAFSAVRACTHFAAPPARLYHLLSDYAHFDSFVPDVAESRVLRRQGKRQQVYQRLDLPAPFRDRHYVIDSEGFGGAEVAGPLSIRWSLDKDATSRLPDIAVMPRKFSGAWRLPATPDAQDTQACYSLHVDPGGNLPAWLFVRQLENYVIRVMRAIARRLTDIRAGAVQDDT